MAGTEKLTTTTAQVGGFASDQVVTAMMQVSDVSRQYVVGSKQSAASAAQLNVLAAELRASIAQFRVA